MAITVERVWDEFDAGLRSFILGRVRDLHAAEDILQDVYVKIHSRVHTLRDEEKVQSWVYQVARNAVNDYYRGAARAAYRLDEAPYTLADSADEEMTETLARSVRRMLECLPSDDREALVLTEYKGLTQAQLAQRLGLSVSGAKSRVQRARAKLKSLLLACCHFELDRAGRVINYEPRQACCSVRGSAGERCIPLTVSPSTYPEAANERFEERNGRDPEEET